MAKSASLPLRLLPESDRQQRFSVNLALDPLSGSRRGPPPALHRPPAGLTRPALTLPLLCGPQSADGFLAGRSFDPLINCPAMRVDVASHFGRLACPQFGPDGIGATRCQSLSSPQLQSEIGAKLSPVWRNGRRTGLKILGP